MRTRAVAGMQKEKEKKLQDAFKKWPLLSIDSAAIPKQYSSFISILQSMPFHLAVRRAVDPINDELSLQPTLKQVGDFLRNTDRFGAALQTHIERIDFLEANFSKIEEITSEKILSICSAADLVLFSEYLATLRKIIENDFNKDETRAIWDEVKRCQEKISLVMRWHIHYAFSSRQLNYTGYSIYPADFYLD